MKITFLCGSLEPGRNGVGDYTRLLAAEVIRQGHQASIIAFNDRHLTALYIGSQYAKGVNVPVVRLPASWTAKTRFERSKRVIDEFDPEWLSLQFVPFSFHEKGLLFGLIHRLSYLGGKRRWHVMFHELWVGQEPGANWKRPIYSSLQKLSIKLLVRIIKFSAVHTHLPVYYTKLKRLNQRVTILPLFSNIVPVGRKNVPEETTLLRIGIFNQIQSIQPIISFTTALMEQAEQAGLSVQLLLIGSNEAKLRSFSQSLADQTTFRGEVNYVGFLEPEELSMALQSCSVGLTSVPRHALGKSGSVAAFIAHGIPVAAPNLFPDHNAQDVGFQADELRLSVLVTPSLYELKCVKKAALVAKQSIQLATITGTFIKDLEQAVSPGN